MEKFDNGKINFQYIIDLIQTEVITTCKKILTTLPQESLYLISFGCGTSCTAGSYFRFSAATS